MEIRHLNFSGAARQVLSLVVLVLVLSGCTGKSQQNDFLSQGAPRGRDRMEEIQSMVESFADSYVTRIASMVDETFPLANSAEERALFHRNKLYAAIGCYTAACEPNPVVAAADLTAFVTLRRMGVEAYLAEHPAVNAKVRAVAMAEFTAGEREAWEMMGRIATPDQVEQLRQAITRWRDRNPQAIRFMLMRLGEFNEYRRVDTGSTSSSVPSNLLQWLYLDPMSSIDPATRQIEESRRLAARAIFYAERVPILFSWGTRQTYLDIAASEEVQTLLHQTDLIASAVDRTSTTVEQFPAVIKSEREAILDNFWKNLRSEREATVANLTSVMQTEREALLQQFAAAVRVEREATIKQLSETIREQREESLRDLSAPQSPLHQSIAAADDAAQRRIDQIYHRAIVLVVVALLGLPISLLLYRVVSGRLRA